MTEARTAGVLKESMDSTLPRTARSESAPASIMTAKPDVDEVIELGVLEIAYRGHVDASSTLTKYADRRAQLLL